MSQGARLAMILLQALQTFRARLIFPGMPTSTADQLRSMIEGLSAAGLSRTEIGRRAGLSRMSVWRYSIGEAREAKHDSFVKLDGLCRKLGVDSVAKDRR